MCRDRFDGFRFVFVGFEQQHRRDLQTTKRQLTAVDVRRKIIIGVGRRLDEVGVVAVEGDVGDDGEKFSSGWRLR